MSLIAEALKAAQDARAEPADRARHAATARRILAPAVRTGGGRREMRVPKQLQVALAVFGVALATAAAVVVAAPSSGEQRLPGAAELAANPMLPADVAADRARDDAGATARDDRTGAAAQGQAAAPAGAAEPTAEVRYPGERPADRPSTTGGGEAQAPRGQRGDQEQGGIAPVTPAPEPAAPPATRPARSGSGFELRMGTPARTSGQWFDDAVAAQRRRDYGAAIQLYERALQETPDNVEALNNLGTVYQASGNLAAAREAFRRAITIQPAYAAAWSNLGVVLGALGEVSQSQAALIEAVRLDPANHGARVNLALQYQKQGLAGEARRLLDQVVSDAPAMAEAHYALGRLLEQEADRDGAVRHYRLFLSTAAGRFPSLDAAVRQRIQQLGG